MANSSSYIAVIEDFLWGWRSEFNVLRLSSRRLMSVVMLVTTTTVTCRCRGCCWGVFHLGGWVWMGSGTSG
jgi:hypothetical protein